MVTEDFSADDFISSVVDNRFEVLAKLGEGGMGAIYKARQLSMDRPVALKILLRDRRGDTISAERFRHEAHLASRLRHPNVVVIYDHGQSDDGLLYIAMELLSGENLKERMQRVGPFDLALAGRVIRQTLHPIDEAHKMGMIHRDLKPANIFLTNVQGDPDFVKVLDFGVAKLTAVQEGLAGYQGGLTVAGTVYGTPNYMSPEQIRGQEVGQQSDIYSLGIIFYEMLCGKRPFEAETPVDVMMMHLRDEPIPPTRMRGDLLPRADAIIRKALAKEVVDRYRTCEAFIEDVEAVLLELRGGLVSGEVRPVGDSRFDSLGSSLGGAVIPDDEIGTVELAGNEVAEELDFDDDLLELDEEKTILEVAEFAEPDGSSIGLDEDDFQIDELFEDSMDGSDMSADMSQSEAGSSLSSLESSLQPNFGREAPRRISGSSPVKQTFTGHPGSGLGSLDSSESLLSENSFAAPAGSPVESRPTTPRAEDGRLEPAKALELGLSSGIRIPQGRAGFGSGSGTGPVTGPVLPPPPSADSSFQIPAAAVRSSVQRPPNGVGSLLRKVGIGAVAIAIGAALVVLVGPMIIGGPPTRPARLAVLSQPVGIEVYSNQRFIGNTPVEIDLSQKNEGGKRSLKLIHGGQSIDMSVDPGDGSLWVYVDFELYNQEGKQGKAFLEAATVERKLKLSGRFVGETPLLFLGQAGRDYPFQIEQGEGLETELVVKPARSQASVQVP